MKLTLLLLSLLLFNTSLYCADNADNGSSETEEMPDSKKKGRANQPGPGPFNEGGVHLPEYEPAGNWEGTDTVLFKVRQTIKSLIMLTENTPEDGSVDEFDNDRSTDRNPDIYPEDDFYRPGETIGGFNENSSDSLVLFRDSVNKQITKLQSMLASPFGRCELALIN